MILILHNNTKWPSRSPNLTPCDLFLSVYLKYKVFRTLPESLNVQRQRIITECNLLKENRGLIRRSVKHMGIVLIPVYREVGVMLRWNCKDFIKNFCFVPAIKVPFFLL